MDIGGNVGKNDKGQDNKYKRRIRTHYQNHNVMAPTLENLQVSNKYA